jgi:hydrogenase expression/formation protein HypC
MCLAVPGRIESISGEDPFTRTAAVSFGGVVRTVSLAYVPDARVGEYVIVHAGFALGRVDEAEAARLFDEIARLAAIPEAEGEPGA